MKKVFNPHRIFLVHQHGRCFIVLSTNMAAVTSCENDLLLNILSGSVRLKSLHYCMPEHFWDMQHEYDFLDTSENLGNCLYPFWFIQVEVLASLYA